VKKKTPPIQSEKFSIPKKPTKSPSNWNKPKLHQLKNFSNLQPPQQKILQKLRKIEIFSDKIPKRVLIIVKKKGNFFFFNKKIGN
jgi:hypothetical protein